MQIQVQNSIISPQQHSFEFCFEFEVEFEFKFPHPLRSNTKVLKS